MKNLSHANIVERLAAHKETTKIMREDILKIGNNFVISILIENINASSAQTNAIGNISLNIIIRESIIQKEGLWIKQKIFVCIKI